MCKICSNTGIVHKEIHPGMVTIDGCNCEVAKQQQEQNQKRWEAWLVRFESMAQAVEAKRNKKVS